MSLVTVVPDIKNNIFSFLGCSDLDLGLVTLILDGIFDQVLPDLSEMHGVTMLLHLIALSCSQKKEEFAEGCFKAMPVLKRAEVLPQHIDCTHALPWHIIDTFKELLYTGRPCLERIKRCMVVIPELATIMNLSISQYA
ncbi:MAG: hypothetical protein R6V33_01635 [Pelovirga sp.]